MLRAILAVIVGYVALAIWVMVTLAVAWFALGSDFAFNEGNLEASTGWSVLMLVLGAIGGVIGGLIAASVGRAASPVKALAGFVLVLGLVIAVMHQMGIGESEDTGQPVAVEELPMWEVATETKQPAWFDFALPFVGCAGVMIGGRMRRSRVSTKATGEVAPD
ncbi:MAG: hypothetical protein V3T48_02150 [Vicinamibacterales bacterium]